VTLDFALARAADIIERLLVYPERMKKNLESMHGLVHSERVLLALTQAGMARETAYGLVQRNAIRAWRGEGTLLDLLKADPEVMAVLHRPALEALFNLDHHLRHVDTIFARVFAAPPSP